MEILTLILKVCAILGLFTLMFLPLANVTAWDDDSWSARYTVSAIATTAWVGLLVFVPGAIIACAVVWAILLLCSLHVPALRNLLPFWRWLLALRHRIKGDSPIFIVERVLGLRPIEDAPTDFKGVRDYLAAYSGYDENGEAMLEFSCGISGVTDDFVEKRPLTVLVRWVRKFARLSTSGRAIGCFIFGRPSRRTLWMTPSKSRRLTLPIGMEKLWYTA